MADDLAAALRDAGAGDVADSARLADLTTLRVGGPIGARYAQMVYWGYQARDAWRESMG